MFILKIILAIIIIGITTYLGILKSKKLYDREYILREMVSFLIGVQNEIKYCLSLLPNAYETSRMGLKTGLKYAIGNISLDMVKDEEFEVERSIVNNISKIEELTEYDKNIFVSTLKNLGKSNVEGQINIIQNNISTIENQIKEANEIKLKNSRMYRTIGMLSGLIIVVLFV
ncbi:MAG: stage III sporulation protein AB [Clostridia bacterium]|nr:stage III sporulation protein AB [Clostridia bacterium]MDD4386960.1 stage III sporulation protein AB [Clostridia bacterium]